MRKQYYLTPAEGKRLIAKALSENEKVLKAANEHTLVIMTGTTNGYVAEEFYKTFGFGSFDRSTFFRGAFIGPKGKGLKAVMEDVMIRKGELITGRTIFDIEPELGKGDMILKGGNAVNLSMKEAGVVIGNEKYGTLDPISVAYYGRRVEVMIPVGLEKRVDRPIVELERFVNSPECSGTRLAKAPGEAFTELDALEMCGLKAVLLGGGGVAGFEGAVMIGVEGELENIRKADKWITYSKGEPVFGE